MLNEAETEETKDFFAKVLSLMTFQLEGGALALPMHVHCAFIKFFLKKNNVAVG